MALEPTTEHNLKQRIDLRDPAALVATWFGAGLLPSAPGTWGSLAALPFAWVIQAFGGPIALAIAVVIVFFLGLWATDRMISGSPDSDPGYIVVDEVAGQWLVLVFVPTDTIVHAAGLYAAGFMVFRLADILKPWPVCWADRAIKGAFGVMFDDILAAVYASAVLAAIAWWFGGM